MEFYISFLLINLILDLSIITLLKRVFGLCVRKIEIVILMLFSLVPGLLFSLYKIKFLYFLLLKIAFYFLVSIFVADSFYPKRFLSIFGFSEFLFFSVYGSGEFFILFVRAVVLTLFKKELKTFSDVIIMLSLIAYIFLMSLCFKEISRHKKLSNLLSKVSFFLFGRHIEITGLIDSGNALYDTKTKKSVIIISLSVLRRFLTESECEMIKNKRYFGLDISHELEYETVGGKKSTMPIVDIGEVELERGGEKQKFKCVLGIVSEGLVEEKRYECLLHREFL